MADSGIELKVISDKLPALLAAMPGKVDEILAKVALDIVAAAQQNAPVRTGYLRASIGAEQTGEHEQTVTVGADYGAYVEQGTVHMAARPFLTPAVEAQRSSFDEAFRVLEGLV